MPSATWGRRHSARSEATSRSQQKVTMQPMPTAKPLTAPTSGLGKLPRISKARSRRFGMPLMNSAAEAMVCVFGSFRFAPAEKAPPASSPVRTAQRISSSSSMAAKWRAMPSLKSAPHALRAPGRLSVTIPMGPRFSNATGMGTSSLGGRGRAAGEVDSGDSRPNRGGHVVEAKAVAGRDLGRGNLQGALAADDHDLVADGGRGHGGQIDPRVLERR